MYEKALNVFATILLQFFQRQQHNGTMLLRKDLMSSLAIFTDETAFGVLCSEKKKKKTVLFQ